MSEQPTPRSLIITLYGAYGRGPGAPYGGDALSERCGEGAEDEGAAAGEGEGAGLIGVAQLVRLLGVVGVDAPAVRSAVSRLKRRGLLVPARTSAGTAGYALSGGARRLLADGDRRIYPPKVPPAEDGWILAVFSVPESERDKRHLLRSRLAGLGFGTAAPGVWIAPAGLHDETRHTLERLRLAPYVELFRAEHLGFAATPEAVARWWDLPSIAESHERFTARHEPVLRAWQDRRTTPPREAYRDYLPALDAWRRLPYADPGLPLALLPEPWPGTRAAEVFLGLHERLRDAGARFARGTASGAADVEG
ncbi:PaaX family transcriptional regulator [Streptomyces tsukubensis]|uniref:PaaX family transcriptional regulator n=1 Tax=Streptomyces tsukubensis TaxID=83656 RepID=A0A1V4AAT1_9ACTN|nr:PaaX family transcriptional regulator C-terminal domain-containing protein [Streptomyces tsukubensis]OON80556.1 PaaX family transcriptional regulator [Streptomyces tsukubensis]QFR96209.1 PaaX family transcriptional regulator [Streptomyces tsukubensis]